MEYFVRDIFGGGAVVMKKKQEVRIRNQEESKSNNELGRLLLEKARD